MTEKVFNTTLKQLKGKNGKTAGEKFNSLPPEVIAKAVPNVVKPGKPPSLEEQMAVQMGWEQKQAEGLPLESSDVQAKFPMPGRDTRLVDLELLYESPHNPRKVFKDLNSLAENIAATRGLLQPIIARRRDNGPHEAYEIAAGARRFRALELLKKQGHELQAWVDVRELSDAQMAEVMMAENDQRDGLLPLEQAHGYSNMLKAGFTVESAAEKLGVSTGTVRGRLALLNLGKRAGKMLLAGELPGAVATKVAQYPEALQEEALDELADQMIDGELITEIDSGQMNARRALAYLQQNFTRSLKSTAFDQKDDMVLVDQLLWPELPPQGDEQTFAPACAKCPRNSKNMPKELAGEDPNDEKRFGFCTLPPCFAAKVEHAAQQLEAKAKAEGLKLLTTQQVWKELRDGRQNLGHGSSFVKLDSIAPADPKKRTYRQLVEAAASATQDKEKPTVHVALTEHAGRVDLAKESEVLDLLSAGEVGWAKTALKAKKATAARRSSSGPSKATMDKAVLQERARVKVRETVYRKVVEKYRSQGPDLEAVRAMIGWLVDEEGPAPVHELFEFKSQKELEAFIEKKATMPELLAVMYAFYAVQEFQGSWRTGYDEEVQRAAKACKLDLKKLEKHELEALQAVAKAETKKA